MNSRWFVLGLAAVLLIVGYSAWPSLHNFFVQKNLAAHSNTDGYGRARVDFSDVEINAKVPLTSALKAKGLAGRTNLSDQEGMLWIYNPATVPTFWMKDMVIPIDIIWIRSGIVREILPEVPPPLPGQQDLPRYRPGERIDAVLEVRAGFAEEHSIMPDTPVRIDIL